MRLAMVIGEQRLAQEQRMLNRLAVGLMAEGVRVTRIVPQGLPTELIEEGERRMALAPRIETTMKALPWMRRFHVRRVVESLEGSVPDALYLLGRDAWAFGLQLAVEIDRPALLEVWSVKQATMLPRPAAHSHMVGIVAPCAGLESVMRARVGNDLVFHVPMGVNVQRRKTRVLADPEHPPAIVVLGGARDTNAYAAVIDGLAIVHKQHPSVQIFLELRGPHEHDIWRLAERAGLLGAVSSIGSAAQHHALIMRCDIVLWPERLGELRSVLLDAMAVGVPTVAALDPALDMLIEGETACGVQQDSPESWAERVHWLIANPGEAQAMGERARERALARHSSSEQVERMMDVLGRFAGKDAYTFPTPE